MTLCTADNVRAFLLRRYATGIQSKGLAPEAVPDQFDLLTEGIIDSLGLLELISATEAEFNIQLDMEQMEPEQLTIIGPFSRYVEQHAVRAGKA